MNIIEPVLEAQSSWAGNFYVPVSAGATDSYAVCKVLSPAVTHETVTMTRRKFMRRDFWDKLNWQCVCEGMREYWCDRHEAWHIGHRDKTRVASEIPLECLIWFEAWKPETERKRQDSR